MSDTTLAMKTLDRITTTPTDEMHWLSLRQKDLTSTEVAALFGMSPFKTYAELWLEKRDNIAVEFKMSKRIKAGQILEPAIAKLIAEDEGWLVRPYKNYISVPSLRIGSSFDYAIYDDDYADTKNVSPISLFEIKNVDQKFWRDWHNEDGELEAKNHIELQCQWQMLVSGIDRLKIGVLFGGNDWYVLDRKYDPVIGDMMLEAVAEFWRKVDANEQPKFDYSHPKDQELIKRLYREANPPKVLRAEDNVELKQIYEAYRVNKKNEAAEKAMADSLRSKIITMIGDASEVYGDGFAFTAKDQEFGDWTDLKLLDNGKFDATTLPKFGELVLLSIKGDFYTLSVLNELGDFNNTSGIECEKSDIVAWAYMPHYKQKTKSRVIRDKKVKLK